MDAIEKRARVLLAAEWSKLDFDAPVDELRSDCQLPPIVAAGVRAIKAALAARQPVGVEPDAWVPAKFFSEGVVAMTARRAAPSEIAEELHGEYLPLFRQPTQAADLEQLPRAVELLSNVSRTLVDWAADEQREAIGIVKALIDHHAVGK